MSRWRDRVDDLLYEGETARERLDLDDAHVVVTSHRVLAFTPHTQEANFRQVDRPNVVGVGTGAREPWNLLRPALLTGGTGLSLLVVGLLFDPSSLFGGTDVDTSAAEEFGLDGVVELTQLMLAFLVNLDAVLGALGLVALTVAAILGGAYWYLRTPTLVIRVAGDDNIHVPRPAETATVALLEEATLPESPAEGSGAESGGHAAGLDAASSGTEAGSADEDGSEVAR